MTRYRDIRIVVVLASLVAVPCHRPRAGVDEAVDFGGHAVGGTTPAVAALGRSIYLFGGVRDDFATFENTFFDDLHPSYTKTNLDGALPGGDWPALRTFAASAPTGTSSATAECAPE